MRLVSRTHRVAFDWLFDRIILEPKIQIKHVDTQNHVAGLLTKGRFARDEWCNLLRLLNIMNLSMFSSGHFRSVQMVTTMWKRIQERKKEDELEVTKPRSVCLISASLPGCFQYPGESAEGFGSYQRSRGKLQAKQCRRSRGKLQAGHCPIQSPQTQKRNLKFGKETTSLKAVAGNCKIVLMTGVAGNCRRDTVQGNMPESLRGCGKLQQKIEIQLQTTGLDHHKVQVTDYGYVEKVFMNLCRKLNRTENDEMFDLKTSVLNEDYLRRRQ